MRFKKANFERNSTFLNCIPAIGEKRKFWAPSSITKKRQYMIAKLKKERQFESLLCTTRRKVFKQYSEFQNKEFREDIEELLKNQIGFYMPKEKNWIRKTYRLLKKKKDSTFIVKQSKKLEYNEYTTYTGKAARGKFGNLL